MMTIDWLEGQAIKAINNNPKPSAVIIIKGATAHEFMAKWNELAEKYGDDFNACWSEIVTIFDCRFESSSQLNPAFLKLLDKAMVISENPG